jgi:hypothetical protein
LLDTLQSLTRQARADARGLAAVPQLLKELLGRLDLIEGRLAKLEARAPGDELRGVQQQLEAVLTQQRAHFELARVTYDNLRSYRERLVAVRATPAYAAAYAQKEPLITVTTPTYQGADVLVDRAVASVQRQTYPNWEMVIVGDGCTDHTAQRLAALGDPRIRFINLPHRGVYPANKLHRWMVAGTPPSNRAWELARGQWLAPLDHDDEFVPEHLEVLLELALRERAELAYGKLERVSPATEAERYIYDFPPRYAQFGFQGSLLHRELRFFEFDLDAWVLNEPGDWNLMRKMLASGVLVAGTDQVVTRYHSSDANLR